MWYVKGKKTTTTEKNHMFLKYITLLIFIKKKLWHCMLDPLTYVETNQVSLNTSQRADVI